MFITKSVDKFIFFRYNKYNKSNKTKSTEQEVQSIENLIKNQNLISKNPAKQVHIPKFSFAGWQTSLMKYPP